MLPPLLPITLEDCEALPDWAAAFLDSGANFKWTRVMAKTSDGYDLTMIRICGDSTGLTTPDTRGPVLFLHDAYNDGLSWMQRSDQTPAAIPVRLYQEGGMDVFIANRRGTAPSRTHDTLNADTDSAYWDWSMDEVGEKDIPAMINKILEVRTTEMLSN